MLIDKEYPATHSMSIAWYIVDEDGNVGIMQFNANGPVPLKAEPDTPIESLNIMVSGRNKQIPISLTDDQIFEMIEGEDENLTDDYCDLCLFKINKDKISEFVETFRNLNIDIYCISEKSCLFYIDTINEIRHTLETLAYSNVIIAKYLLKEYWINDIHSGESDSIIEKNFEKSPYYIYFQNYSSCYYPERRIIVPDNPVKITQFPEEFSERMIKLPFKFSETETFRIDQYTECKHDSCLDGYGFYANEN